jgi:hypothetical protein
METESNSVSSFGPLSVAEEACTAGLLPEKTSPLRQMSKSLPNFAGPLAFL